MDAIKARLGENSTFAGAAILAFVGSKYGPEAATTLTEVVAGLLALYATVMPDKAPK